MANAILSPERSNAIPTDVSEEKANTLKRKAESAAPKKPSSKSAKSDSLSSLSAAASSSKDRGSDRPTAVASQGMSGSDPSISDVLNVFKTIQESQCKSDQNFNVLSHRVDKLFKMAEDYDDCGDYGLIPDSDVDVVTVDDCTADHSVDTSNANKDTTTSSNRPVKNSKSKRYVIFQLTLS